MKAILDERYAEALLHIASRNGLIQEYADDLETVGKVVEEHPGPVKVFSNPRVSMSVKADIIEGVFKKGTYDKYFINFLKVLAESGRIKDLPDILREYLDLAREHHDILTITVETPMQLVNEQVEEIRAKCMKEFSAKKVRAEVVINSDLIGGIKVTAGNIVMDSSLQRQLADIQKLFTD